MSAEEEGSKVVGVSTTLGGARNLRRDSEREDATLEVCQAASLLFVLSKDLGHPSGGYSLLDVAKSVKEDVSKALSCLCALAIDLGHPPGGYSLLDVVQRFEKDVLLLRTQRDAVCSEVSGLRRDLQKVTSQLACEALVSSHHDLGEMVLCEVSRLTQELRLLARDHGCSPHDRSVLDCMKTLRIQMETRRRKEEEERVYAFKESKADEKKIAGLQARVQQLKNDQQRTLERSNSEAGQVAVLKTQVQQFQERNLRLELEKAEQQAKSTDLQQHLQQARTDAGAAKNVCEELQLRTEELERSLQEKDKYVHDTGKSKAAMKAKLSQLEAEAKENRTLKDKFLELRAENEGLVEHLEELSDDLAALKHERYLFKAEAQSSLIRRTDETQSRASFVEERRRYFEPHRERTRTPRGGTGREPNVLGLSNSSIRQGRNAVALNFRRGEARGSNNWPAADDPRIMNVYEPLTSEISKGASEVSSDESDSSLDSKRRADKLRVIMSNKVRLEKQIKEFELEN